LSGAIPLTKHHDPAAVVLAAPDWMLIIDGMSLGLN